MSEDDLNPEASGRRDQLQLGWAEDVNQRQDFSRASRTDGLDHLVSPLAVRGSGLGVPTLMRGSSREVPALLMASLDTTASPLAWISRTAIWWSHGGTLEDNRKQWMEYSSLIGLSDQLSDWPSGRDIYVLWWSHFTLEDTHLRQAHWGHTPQARTLRTRTHTHTHLNRFLDYSCGILFLLGLLCSIKKVMWINNKINATTDCKHTETQSHTKWYTCKEKHTVLK